MFYIYMNYFKNKEFNKQLDSVESMIKLTANRLTDFKEDISDHAEWDKKENTNNAIAYYNLKPKTSKAELKATMHLLRKELIRLDKML